MKKYINLSLIYAISGLLAGLFYREFTKWNGFTGVTTLGKVHTHLFMLGMFLFLLVALFAQNHDLEGQKVFPTLHEGPQYRPAPGCDYHGCSWHHSGPWHPTVQGTQCLHRRHGRHWPYSRQHRHHQPPAGLEKSCKRLKLAFKGPASEDIQERFFIRS